MVTHIGVGGGQKEGQSEKGKVSSKRRNETGYAREGETMMPGGKVQDGTVKGVLPPFVDARQGRSLHSGQRRWDRYDGRDVHRSRHAKRC